MFMAGSKHSTAPYACAVPWLSDDGMWEFFGTRGLFQASYGAADFGECQQAVQRVGSGGADDWYRKWAALADGLVETADADAAAGRPASARDGYIRATTYYRVAYLPLYGEPTDPRLADAFTRESDALAKYAPLHDTPVELVEIPFEDGHTLPGVLALAADDGRQRATIVHVNGYDSSVNEMFVSHALAANARGYNVLLFDGPGQGRNLIRDGMRIRPDWENVVRPVIDYALERPEIDPERIITSSVAGASAASSRPARPRGRTGSPPCGPTRASGTRATRSWPGSRSRTPTRPRSLTSTRPCSRPWSRRCAPPMPIPCCTGRSSSAGSGSTASRRCSTPSSTTPASRSPPSPGASRVRR
jgi:hypothetical protein